MPAYLSRTLTYLSRAQTLQLRTPDLSGLVLSSLPQAHLPQRGEPALRASHAPGAPRSRRTPPACGSSRGCSLARPLSFARPLRDTTARAPPSNGAARRVRRRLSALTSVRTLCRPARPSAPTWRPPRPPRSFRTLGLPPYFGGAIAYHQRLLRRYRYHQNQAYRLAEAREPSGSRYRRDYTTERVAPNGDTVTRTHPPIPYWPTINLTRRPPLPVQWARARPSDLPPFNPERDTRDRNNRRIISRRRDPAPWVSPWPIGPGPLLTTEPEFISRLAERFTAI